MFSSAALHAVRSTALARSRRSAGDSVSRRMNTDVIEGSSSGSFRQIGISTHEEPRQRFLAPLVGALGQLRESNSGARLRDALVDVRMRPSAGHLGDLAVAEAGDQEGEVCALAFRKVGEDRQGFASLKDVVDREPVGDDGVAGSVGEHRLEVDVPTLALAEPEGLPGGDDVEPAEDRGPVGLSSEHDRPRVLTGVLDQFARGVHGVGDGAAEVVVVSAVELVFVGAPGQWRWRRCGFDRGLYVPFAWFRASLRGARDARSRRRSRARAVVRTRLLRHGAAASPPPQLGWATLSCLARAG